MTVETFTPHVPQLIQSTGPFTAPWPARAPEDVRVVIFAALGAPIELDPADFTVTLGPSQTDVVLSSSAFVAHQGASLWLDRSTVLEQGWLPLANPREAGLADQLDRLTFGVQEARYSADATLRLERPVLPVSPRPGSVLIFGPSGQPINGPTADQIGQAQGHAISAAGSSAAAQAHAAAAAQAAALAADYPVPLGQTILLPDTLGVPDGFLPAEGSTYPIDEYQRLFVALNPGAEASPGGVELLANTDFSAGLAGWIDVLDSFAMFDGRAGAEQLGVLSQAVSAPRAIVYLDIEAPSDGVQVFAVRPQNSDVWLSERIAAAGKNIVILPFPVTQIGVFVMGRDDLPALLNAVSAQAGGEFDAPDIEAPTGMRWMMRWKGVDAALRLDCSAPPPE